MFGSACALSSWSRVSWFVVMGSRPLIPCATSPSAMPFTSSGWSLQKSAICSNVNEVFSTSQTAVALGIRGAALLMERPQRAADIAFPATPVPDEASGYPRNSRGRRLYRGRLVETQIMPAKRQKTVKPPLRILLCAPRGFCAGVVRAIDAVERALEKYGPPVYVRHEIVHNKYVVEGLRKKGAVFVEELDEVPDGDRPVIFSAHGVPKSVPEEAGRRALFAIDATCPLVTKVHREAMVHFKRGREIVLVGHRDHPEVVGTMGQLPNAAVTLVETAGDARSF